MTYSDITDKEFNKLKFGWSKYGGANLGLVKDRIDDEWCCQCCGKSQPKGAPTFLFEFAPADFLRICAICENKRVVEKIENFSYLKKACT